MTLSMLPRLILLAILVMSSTACSRSLFVKDVDKNWCPSAAFVGELEIPDPPQERRAFEVWAGDLVVNAQDREAAYQLLLECWEAHGGVTPNLPPSNG